MSAGNQSGVKAIFSRCLLHFPSVNLWRSYLTFIKTVRSAPEVLRDTAIATTSSAVPPLQVQPWERLTPGRGCTAADPSMMRTAPAAPEPACRSILPRYCPQQR